MCGITIGKLSRDTKTDLGFEGQQFSQALAPKKLDHHYLGWPKAIYIFLLNSNGKA